MLPGSARATRVAEPGARDDTGPGASRRARLRVSIGTLLFAAVVAAILSAVVTTSVLTARSREVALESEVTALSIKLAAAAQALENCQASRQSVSDAVGELAAARDDMDRALAGFDRGVAMDITESAIVAANARYAGALTALTAIPGCASN